jgi:hypothetical protein
MTRNLGYHDHFIYELIEKFFQGQDPEKINKFFRDYPGRTKNLLDRADSEIYLDFRNQDVPDYKIDLSWIESMINLHDSQARWEYRGYWQITDEGRIEINPAFK